jgi:hypothetical protein
MQFFPFIAGAQQQTVFMTLLLWDPVSLSVREYSLRVGTWLMVPHLLTKMGTCTAWPTTWTA